MRSIIETPCASANLDPINEDNITLGVILLVHQESIIKITLQMEVFCNFSELIFTHPYCKVVMPSVLFTCCLKLSNHILDKNIMKDF